VAISSVLKLKRIRQAPGAPQPRGRIREPVQCEPPPAALSLSTRIASRESCNWAEKISIGPFNPRSLARTFCNCVVPVISGAEKPVGAPASHRNHDPATSKSTSVLTSALVRSAATPDTPPNFSVRYTSPSPVRKPTYPDLLTH